MPAQTTNVPKHRESLEAVCWAPAFSLYGFPRVTSGAIPKKEPVCPAVQNTGKYGANRQIVT